MTDTFTHIDELETPSVLIDLDIVESNITRIQERCNELNLRLRPHIKTHKMPLFAQMQVNAGAQGIACQKVSEAEVFADAGFSDIQIPYNIIGKRKTARLAELAKRCQISMTIDSIAVAEGLVEALRSVGAKIAVLVDLVTPRRRTGIDIDGALELAKFILSNEDCFEFQGVAVYPCSAESSQIIRQCRAKFADAGIEIPFVSGGGSGAIHDPLAHTELDEVRMGTYIFYDWRSVTLGWATIDDCAMRVRASVISANDADRVILDSGSKTLSSDNIDGQYGYILEAPEARIYQLNEEHAYVDFTECETMPQVGDILHILPVHTCVVTNLHNQVYGVRGEAIETIYDVAARGLVW